MRKPCCTAQCFAADSGGYVPAPLYYTNGAAGRSLTGITNTQTYEAQNNITDPFFPLTQAQAAVYQYTTNSIYGAASTTTRAIWIVYHHKL